MHHAAVTNQLKATSVVRPLPGLPGYPWLVVDMRASTKQYEKVKPFLQNAYAEAPAIRASAVPEEREKLDGLYECILCAAADITLRPAWWNPDSSWVQLRCYKPTASWQTAVIPNVQYSGMTRSAYSAAAGS